MNLRNKIQLIGNVGGEPQFREFPSGAKMARIAVATNDYVRKNNIVVKQTEWHSVVLWGSLADLAREKLCKGVEVVVDGCLRQASFTDRNGVEQQVYEVVADKILFSRPNN